MKAQISFIPFYIKELDLVENKSFCFIPFSVIYSKASVFKITAYELVITIFNIRIEIHSWK